MSMSSGSRDYGRFDALAEEFAERYRRGERPSLQEYVDRLPEMADEIREMFPALVEVERVEEDARDDARQPSMTIGKRPREIGDYRVVREVGRGGMGVVYEAEQISLGRRVALKVLPSHVVGDRKALERFRREAKAAARLHHTNIVPVFEVGRDGETAFYAMQFIQGQGLDQVIDELRRMRGRDKAPAERGHATPRPPSRPEPAIATVSLAGIGSQRKTLGHVAESLLVGRLSIEDPPTAEEGSHPATEAAEVEAIVPAATVETGPRDANRDHHKPVSAASSSSSAVLPGGTAISSIESSGRRQPFYRSVAQIGRQAAQGLAYAHSRGVIHRDIKPSNLLLDTVGVVWITDFGLAKAEDDGLTASGDILGTLRYMAPERFRGEGDARTDIYALGLTLYELLTLRPAHDVHDRLKLIERVKNEEPPRPRSLDGRIPRDLETIVLKAIDKAPSRRYATSEAMAEDLRRFLDDEPIAARRESMVERYARWARHHPGIATLGAVLTAVLILSTVASLIVARRMSVLAEDRRLGAMAERSARRDADRTAKAEIAARGEADKAREAAKQARDTAALQAAGLLLDRGIEDARAGEPARALHLFVQALRALPADDERSAPLERVIRANLTAWAENVPALESIWTDAVQSSEVAFTPDGDRLAVVVGKGEIHCVRCETGQPVGPPIKFGPWVDGAMEFHADGRSLWVSSPAQAGSVDQWALYRFDPETGRPVQPPIPSTGPVGRVVVTPNGRYLVGLVWGLHPEDRGGLADAERTHRWRTVAIVVWDAASGRVVRTVGAEATPEHPGTKQWPDSYLDLSPDGGTVTAWIQREANRFEQIRFRVDGDEAPVHRELPEVDTSTPWKLHFGNHMRAALVLRGGQLHRWSLTAPGVLGPGTPSPFRYMLYGPSADGRSVTSQVDGRVYDTGTWPPRPSGTRFNHPSWQRNTNAWFESSPDGRFATSWVASTAGSGRLWRLPRPHSRPAAPASEGARQVERETTYSVAEIDPSGTVAVLWPFLRARWVQSGETTHALRIVDLASGAARATSVRPSQLVRDAVFTPDGRYFATASFDGTARVWETATGRPAGPPLRHANYVASVAFAPDGQVLAAGDYGPRGLVKFWDWRTGKEARAPLKHDDIVLSVAFSPDGRYLAVVKAPDWSGKPEFLVWEIASDKVVFRAAIHAANFLNRRLPQFRIDSRAVAIRDANGVLRLWDVPSGELLGERPLDDDGAMRFSPDGRIVAAAANLGVRLLDGETLAPLTGGFLPHPDTITDLRFSPDGASLLVGHESGSAQLWDVATRKPIGAPAVLIGPIRAVGFTADGETCVCVAADGTSRRWPVPSPLAEPELDRLADRIALMTGQRMDDSQGLDFLTAEEWRSLRAKLVGEGSTALVPPRPDADWLDAAASDAEQDGDVHGAEWHLDRLAALRPDDWTIPARRGRVLAAAGRHDEADTAYAEARRLATAPRVLSDWLRAAATDDELAGRKDGAVWNLDRAVSLTPDDWTLYAMRANLVDPHRAADDYEEAIRHGADPGLIILAADRAAVSGDWKRSAMLFNKVDSSVVNARIRYFQAVACLKADDAAAYRATCAEIGSHLPPVGPELSPTEANTAAMAFALGPDATDDWAAPLAWIDHALARLKEDQQAHPEASEDYRKFRQMLLNTRGAVLYRAGRLEEAATVLREGMGSDPSGGLFEDWLFLALVEHALGHADAAREAVLKARALKPKAESAPAWSMAEANLLDAQLNAIPPPPCE